MSVCTDTFRPRYGVQKANGWYRITNPEGAFVGQPYSGKKAAQEAADRMQAEADQKAKRGERCCLRCGSPFLSEGIHNRMCNRCRGLGDVGSLSLPATSTAKIRRAAQS